MLFDALGPERRELAKAPELWQFDLLDSQELQRFARERGIPMFRGETVDALWASGILRADLIRASRRLETPSLVEVAAEDGLFAYCDLRAVEHRADGYGGIFAKIPAVGNDVELLFHPFRLYVLHHVHRVFQDRTISTQFLSKPGAIVRFANEHIEHLNRWTSGPTFPDRFEYWNRVAEVAIVLEPTTYAAVFHATIAKHPETLESITAKLEARRKRIGQMFRGSTVQEVNEVRQDLCTSAEMLDGNKAVHVLLRFVNPHYRLRLQGALGAAMTFSAMAEVIRRAAEDGFATDLPEEDVLGFGQWMDGARKSLYGSDRIIDSDRTTRRQLLSSLGLDWGTKVRCYVEGETELGALSSAIADGGGIEFVNLRGQVVERRGRGLNFVDSLRTDKKANVFSVVVVDRDRADNVRAVKRAAASGDFFGSFFVLDPDFECANFSVRELAEVLLALTVEPVDADRRRDLFDAVSGAKSGEDFFERVKSVGITDVTKSEQWGVALMKHALMHPEVPAEHSKAGKPRSVIEIARLLVQTRRVGYLESIAHLKVNPETGALEKR